jgi:hypothetical protein
MRSFITAVSFCAALAMPFGSFAQEQDATHHHYKLVDTGTLGGPNNNFSGPGLPILNNRGTFATFTNTSTPNPNAGCFLAFNSPDCFVEHAAVWHNGTLIDLGVLPGGANSQTTSLKRAYRRVFRERPHRSADRPAGNCWGAFCGP